MYTTEPELTPPRHAADSTCAGAARGVRSGARGLARRRAATPRAARARRHADAARPRGDEGRAALAAAIHRAGRALARGRAAAVAAARRRAHRAGATLPAARPAF